MINPISAALVVFLSSQLCSNGLVFGYNLCCSFPCQNGGICITKGFDDFQCDCTDLEFYGKLCETPTTMQWFKQLIQPRKETLQHAITNYPWIWGIVNRISFLHNFIMRYIYISRGEIVDSPPRYSSGHEYITLDAHFNTSYYARSLPPIPKDCPTPMGVAGNKQLPDIDNLVKKFFMRKRFIPEPHGTNVLFAYYAQHFTHQFFRTNWNSGPGFDDGSDGVDVSHIYGADKAARDTLRSFTNGKLKSQIINGEEYPPYQRDAAVAMMYPPEIDDNQKFGLGHPFYALLPGLFAYSTIWLREHNRVCNALMSEHPEWDDERLFQTARLIILGETIKITIEDYVQHLSQYNFQLTFEPKLIHGTRFQYNNRIRVEFNHLYHWHPLFPDSFNINKTRFMLEDMLYNVDTVLKYGLTAFVSAMIHERAGALSHHNHHHLLIPVLKKVIAHGRQLKLQSFNQYRRRFSLKPAESFLEFTGDEDLAKELEVMYGSIEALEFYPGMLLERPGSSVTPTTMVEIGGPYSVKGLMANPICTKQYWKPSTFGGDVGFEIVQTATLQKLFCQNLKGECPYISFKVPEGIAMPELNGDKDEL